MFSCLSEVIACLNQRLSRTENYFITWRLDEIILFFKLRLKWHGLSVWRINAWSSNVVYARQTLFTCEWSNANKLWPPLLFPDCNANGIASIPGGFIVMEERVNHACHLKPCAGLKCKIFLLTATIFVGLQMIKKKESQLTVKTNQQSEDKIKKMAGKLSQKPSKVNQASSSKTTLWPPCFCHFPNT